ncbi:MAG: pitrilysin family protein [Candidatus Omnitrophica bacterium]|nr:pitrilysin family protein [Candidatus Omnitrophota bacterium]
MYKKSKLDNGLRIIAHSMANMQSVAIGVWIKVGGRYENFKNKGVSHFLEHLLFKGTKKYSCRKIKESIEGVGGALNGFTSEELTCYLVKIPARHLNLALDILSDMVANPLLPKLEVEKEKQVILEELKMYKDQPQSYVFELLDELLWPAQPIGSPIIGTVESLTEIDRQVISSFKERHYTAPNIVVSAAGLLDFHQLEKNVAKIFSGKKKDHPNTFLAAREAQNKSQVKLFRKDTEQTHLALGFHSFKRDHHLKHALGLLNVILGANMSSRLFNELREKRGLAYEIGTSPKRFYDTGAFIVHAGIDNRKVIEAIELILKELTRIKGNLVTEDEFKRAKDFYLGQLLLALEDTMDNMLWIGETTATLDKTYTITDIVAEVKKVTREDLRETAKQIFQEEKINLALIGPLADGEKKICQYLHLGR